MSQQNTDPIVITGIGLTAPNGNNLAEFRKNLLEGVSGLTHSDIRYMGQQVVGFCQFDATKYQKKKNLRRGTRAGSIAIYCAHEALADAGLSGSDIQGDRTGVFVGITEHGNVETENEIYNIQQHDFNTDYWSPHHNPRTVANSPAGEVTLSLGVTGPHYTIGAACAGGNLGIIQGAQMLQLGEVDVAICGGVSESPNTFGIFAGFKSQGALAYDSDPTQAIRPLDKTRKGTVICEGGALFILEKKSCAVARGARIYGEVAGYAVNSDASDYVNPNTQRQMQCMQKALDRAQLKPENVDVVSMHATGTGAGDTSEASAVREFFKNCEHTYINYSKGHIGHTMGAAGALELAGNLPSFEDDMVHPGLNCIDLDPECEIPRLVRDKPVQPSRPIQVVLNNSFGMLGINSCVIVKKYQ